MNSLSRYRLSLTGLILAAVVVLLVGCTGAWDGGPFDGWGTGGGAIRWGTGVADGDPGGFGVSMSKVPAGSTVAFEDSRTGATSARSAGTFVVGVPSLPGADLDADAVFGSLADPALTAWSRQVRESKNAIR